MELIDTILFYGVLTSSLLSTLILISFYIQPRIWMQDLPKEVQQTMPPKSKKEKRMTLLVLIIFLGIIILLPAIAVTKYNLQATLMQAWFISYCVYFIFNLADLLFIDWLIVCTITPSFIKVKGVDETIYKNYRKHLKDFLKGTVFISVPSFLSALIGYYIL